ncbi:hypothetical protein [Bacteroides sp.]|nr:hypothetical protein [Bacteroides sp.]
MEQRRDKEEEVEESYYSLLKFLYMETIAIFAVFNQQIHGGKRDI